MNFNTFKIFIIVIQVVAFAALTLDFFSVINYKYITVISYGIFGICMAITWVFRKEWGNTKKYNSF